VTNKYNSFAGRIKRINAAFRSGSPAARLGLLLEAIKPFTHFLDMAVTSLPGAGRGIKSNLDTLPACLLVVGPPRSGSTIIYQVLVRAIPSVYISNMHFIFPRYASTHMLKNNLFGAGLGGFHNYYGHTAALYDVNEGNEPMDRLFQGSAVPDQIRQGFISFVENMQAEEGRPLIFKNAGAFGQLTDLHKAVPEIAFLRIKRDPEQIIQSVVRAYHELGGFNPIPDALRHSTISDPVEFAVRQILEIERVIDAQRLEIDSHSWIEFSYEDFCRNPWPMIENLAANHLGIDLACLRRNAVPKLQVSTRSKVSEEEARKIKSFLQSWPSRSDAFGNRL